MSRSKKQEKPRRSRGSLSQYGLFDVGSAGVMDLGLNDEDDSDMDDEELEAELNMLMSGSTTATRPAPPPRPRKVARGAVKDVDLLVSQVLEDSQSGAEEELDDDDPSLLAELNELMVQVAPAGAAAELPVSAVSAAAPAHPTPEQQNMVTVLEERLSLYTQAEQAARLNNDSVKARRYKRGLDQCRALLRRAQAGQAVNEEEIPVPVAVPKPHEPGVDPPPPPSAHHHQGMADGTAQSAPAVDDREKQRITALLTARRDQYKAAALAAKRRDDIDTTMSYVKIIKQFDVVLEAVEKGKPVDLSTMPPPPPAPTDPVSPAAPESSPAADPPSPAVPESAPAAISSPQQPSIVEEPLTVQQALESRLAKYKQQEEAAKQEHNSSKARRMGRIIKQYQQAIVLHSNGKPIPIDDLPTPPGFPPIPVSGQGSGAAENRTATPATAGGAAENRTAAPPDQPTAPASGTLSPPAKPAVTVSPARPPASPTPSQSSVPPSRGAGGAVSRNEKQLAVLLQRQKEYRDAAVRAQRANNPAKAKEYLKLSKGFDSVIEATRCGLPVDMDTLPRSLSSKSPELESYEIVQIDDCIEGSDMEIFDRILSDLKNQLKMCLETLNHFKAIGDVANANRFENLASNTKRDYNTVRGAHITCSPVPKFHYEQRSFSIVRCNVDLNDNELELSIIQGINYNVPNPKEIDTYVRYEFPLLNDEVRSEKTSTVYNTNNPEYKTVFMIPIQRNSRPFQRLFKRHSIKLQIWSKGGFFRSDQPVATVQVKLQPLETKCTIHDAFDLMDGRRPLGGKLEVKVRLRNPILTKQVELIKEKWLVID